MKLLPVSMYYNPLSIATILSMKDVLDCDQIDATFDSRIAREFVVTFKENTYLFKQCKRVIFTVTCQVIIKININLEVMSGVR